MAMSTKSRNQVKEGVLTVGVVGCGYWGPNLVRNFSDLPETHLAAICDLDPERLAHVAGRYPGTATHVDFSDMLNDESLDAVAIATPVPTHYELAKAALLAGKHILIEKPIATSVSQCQELNALASERGLTLMSGHTYLFSEPVLQIKRCLDAGEIGEVLYINSQRLNLGIFRTDINAAWDLAPHDLSIILYLLGETPDSVNCQGNAHITPGVEDVTNISLNFIGKRFATIQSSWLEPRKVRLMTIVGTKKMIVYDDLEPHEKIRIFDTRVERPPHYDTYAQFHYSYHYGNCHIPYLKQSEPLQSLCQHFAHCVRTGELPRTSGEHGQEVVRILEACSDSLRRNGESVPLNPAPSGSAAICDRESIHSLSPLVT